MADRTAAGIFSKVFNLLAKNPTEENKEMALEFWEDSQEFDFSPYQMDCDEELIKLGLAKMEGEEILYYNQF